MPARRLAGLLRPRGLQGPPEGMLSSFESDPSRRPAAAAAAAGEPCPSAHCG